MSMPQVRIHGTDDVRIDQVEIPTVGPDDVLVQVALCGICGSDLGYIAMGGITQPMPIGHELVGTVSAAGANVRGVAVGDRVCVNPMANANSIGNGGPEGAFAPYLLVRGVTDTNGALYPLPSQLQNRQAAMVEPLAVALHGCHRGRARVGDKAVIFGAGPIGLCVAVCLRYLGLENVVVADLSGYRLDAAERIGAIPFKVDDGDLSAFLRELHGEAEIMGVPVPATDLYFEATGAGPVFEQAVNLGKTGARVVVIGVHKAPVSLDLVNLLLRELDVVGAMAYPQEFPEVIDMLASGQVDIEPLISHCFPLSQFPEALAQARDAGSAIKVLVDCQV